MDITRERRTETKMKSRAAIYSPGKQTGVFGKKRPRRIVHKAGVQTLD